MAKESLAVKYRPKSFNDLTEQEAIKVILENQINSKSFQQAYLFLGPAGTGKTTSARIFADMINGGKGNPIEVDAASNSGVDNIRTIIDDSKKKSLESEYKIFIIDECHSLSNGAWQAMLKLLEEPPKFSIFILCTTDPQKIPATILSRVQTYQFNKISNDGIVERLKTIINKENIENYENSAIDYIAKISCGGMRDAITTMDKCLSLSSNLTLDNVLKTVGNEDYETYFKLADMLLDKNEECVEIIDKVFDSGKDVKQFMVNFMYFCLDVAKYDIFRNLKTTNLPENEEMISKLSSITKKGDISRFLKHLNDINNLAKYSQDPKGSIEIGLIIMCEE